MSSAILAFAKTNAESFPLLGVSSNEIRAFRYEGAQYILKTPAMTEATLSPFWRMMKNVFGYTFERQNARLEQVYHAVRKNPHLPAAELIVADEQAAVFKWMDGQSVDQDEFPQGKENAYRLGQYVGWIHQTAYPHCGVLGTSNRTDFFSAALAHMENCVQEYWNSGSAVDQKVQSYLDFLQNRSFESSRLVLMMADISADQFLYSGEELACCVDLDAYVIGPAEWELSLLFRQIYDWDLFKAGYERYQPLPPFEETAGFYRFLMTLNEHRNKQSMERLMNELCTSM